MRAIARVESVGQRIFWCSEYLSQLAWQGALDGWRNNGLPPAASASQNGLNSASSIYLPATLVGMITPSMCNSL